MPCISLITHIDWFQTISNNSRIDPPGMTMRAKCIAAYDENDLQLTNKERLTDIPITVGFENRDAPPVRGNGQPLERGDRSFQLLRREGPQSTAGSFLRLITTVRRGRR